MVSFKKNIIKNRSAGGERVATVRVNGTAYSVAEGTNLGVFLASIGLGHRPCGGHGRCGQCRVTAGGALNSLTAVEREKLSAEQQSVGVRLACCTVIEGDACVTVDGTAPVVCAEGTAVAGGRPRFSRYGVAMDIGSTTLAARLYDTAGRLLAETGCGNPQTAWGADVVSRVEAALGGAGDELASACAQAIDNLWKQLTTAVGIRPTDVDGAVVTGNTAMLSLLVGESVESLARAPFAPPQRFGEVRTAGQLGLTAPAAETPVFLPSCIGAFVGADALTAALAVSLQEGDMLVDIGTNGEIVLCADGRLRCGSVAAGPAFEGAGISMGMPAADGAVDHVVLQGQTPVPHVIGDGVPRGICGSGLVDAIACLLDTHRLTANGLLRSAPMPIAPPVSLTQADIRAVQMAKAAVCAGIETILKAVGRTPADIQTLYIAGGFGHSLDAANAGRIGLIPPETVTRVRAVGNAALVGAAELLLNSASEAESRRLAATASVVELSTDPLFAEAYIRNMNFEGGCFWK